MRYRPSGRHIEYRKPVLRALAARGPLSPPTIAQSSFQKIGWRLSMDKRAAFVPQPKKRLFVTIVTMKPGRISI